MKSPWTLIACIGLIGCMNLDTSEMYMKPGALDASIPAIPYYVRHTFKLMGKYRVSHEWLGSASACGYGGYFGTPPGIPLRIRDSLGEITETEGRKYYTADKSYVGVKKNGEIWRSDFDRYVSAEWQSTDGKGKVWTHKGFVPTCAQGWVGTSHSLSINLVKLKVSDAIKRYTEPDVPLQEVQIGGNTWATQNAPLMPREINTIAGPYLSWLLPIGDTGYTFVFELGANQNSLKHPEAHARMQEIFRHLIESVKIETLDANAK